MTNKLLTPVEYLKEVRGRLTGLVIQYPDLGDHLGPLLDDVNLFLEGNITAVLGDH